MPARFDLITFESGPTVGVVFNLPFKGGLTTIESPINDWQGYIVFATDDTVSWAVQIKPSQERSGERSAFVHAPRHYIPDGAWATARYQGPIRQGSLTVRYQMLYEWARSIAVKLIKRYGIDAVGKGEAVDAAATSPLKALPSLFANDQVGYLDFNSVKRSSAHSLDALHALVLKAQDTAQRVWWGWTATNLQIQFHESKSMGAAWEPGNPANASHGRRICLNRKLLAQYDAHSIWRVIIHELCHHFREESERRVLTSDNAHDGVFCRMLTLADPEAVGSQCQFFEAAPDPSLVSVSARARGKQPVFDPALGTLLISAVESGGVRMQWISKTPDLKWSSQVLPVSDGSILEMLKRFAPSTWGDVEVTKGARMNITSVTSLGTFVAYLLKAYPHLMTKTKELVASSGVFTEVSRAS
jgi:hypothetical protein